MGSSIYNTRGNGLSNVSSATGLIGTILGGASASFAMGANTPGLGVNTEWDKFSMPYTYGGPSGYIGTVSGQYAGGGIKSQMMPWQKKTKLGSTLGKIGSVIGIASGNTSGISDIYGSPEDAKNQLYEQWAGNQSDMITGKKGIYIKPSKRGSFTAWCKSHGYGGVTGACKSAGRNSKSAAIRKKAVFATNAAKWKH